MLKKIFAALLCAALLTTCSLAFTVEYMDPDDVFLPPDSATEPGDGDEAPVIVSTGVDPEASGKAYARTQTVKVDGKDVTFQMYALKNAAGNETNYIKLRDLADILDGSAAQFNVGWDGNVNLEKGVAYTTRNGQEGKTPYKGDQTYKKCVSVTKVDGTAVDLKAFTITDASGGGSNYFKLRDLGQALGFNVGYDNGVFVETDKAYDPAN